MVNGNVALVTGSSRGIGRACIELMAESGWDVIINYFRSQEEALEVEARVKAQGVRTLVCEADVSDPAQVKGMFKAIMDSLGRLDCLVNNAGIYPRKELEELDLEIWEHTMATNLTSAFQCTMEALPLLEASASGTVINITSQLAYTGSSHGIHYATSKAAMMGMTKSFALALASKNIRVNAVAPGATETDILANDTPEKRAQRNKAIPLGRIGQPEEVAAAVEYLASEASGFMTGQTVHVNGGYLMW